MKVKLKTKTMTNEFKIFMKSFYYLMTYFKETPFSTQILNPANVYPNYQQFSKGYSETSEIAVDDAKFIYNTL